MGESIHPERGKYDAAPDIVANVLSPVTPEGETEAMEDLEVGKGDATTQEGAAGALDRRQFVARAGGVVLAVAGAGAIGSSGALAAPRRTAGAAAQPFKGQTVTVAVGSFMSTGVTLFTSAWEQQTGGKVNVVQIPFGDLYQRLFAAFNTGAEQFDIAVYAANWIPEFAISGHLLSLEKYYPKKANWSSVVPKTKKIMYVGGQRYSVPMDGDVIFGYYRKDALENPAHKAKFKAKYGYALAAPVTWKQYRDIAEFFTGWDWAGNGKQGWGVLEAQKPKDVGPFMLTSRATAYAAHPKVPGHLFFDPDTMEPSISNPGWAQALTDFKEIRKFGPPEMTNYGGGDMRGNFVAGNYALGIDWADVGIIAQDPKSSIVKGKIGYFILPGSNKVWNPKSKAWDTFAKPSHGPYLGWGGWHGSVVKNTKHADAAWDFLNFLDSTKNALTAVTTPGTARNPYRTEHFTQVKAWETASVHYKDPGPYLRTITESMNHPNTQFDLRIPKAGQYFDVLDNWMQQALAGNMTPEKALAKAADEWKGITSNAGAAQQQKLYRELYGL